MKRIVSSLFVFALLSFVAMASGCSGKGSEETDTPVRTSFDTRLTGISEISQDVYCESTPMASHPSHCRKGTTSFIISGDGTFTINGFYGILNEDEITSINEHLAGINLDVEEVCEQATNLKDSAVLAVKRDEQPIRLLLEDKARGDVCVRGDRQRVEVLHAELIKLIVKYDELDDEVTRPPTGSPSPGPMPVPLPTRPPTQASPRPTAAPSPRNPGSSPRPTPTVTPHPRPRPSPRPTATPERPSPHPSATPRATARPSATPRPSSTPHSSATPRPRPTARPSATPRPRVTPRPSSTPRSSATPRPSSTPQDDGGNDSDE